MHMFLLAPTEFFWDVSNSLKPLGQLKPNSMWHHHGIGEKMESLFNDLGHLLLYIIVNPRGGGI